MSVTIHVGPTPNRYDVEGQFFDGQSADITVVRVTVDEDAQTLVATAMDGQQHIWKLADIREVPDQAGGDIMVLRLRDDLVQRLHLPDQELEPRLPMRRARAPVTRRGRLLVWAMAAVASVALIVFVLVPKMADQLANFIPPEGEAALGEVTLTQIRDALDDSGLAPVAFCERSDGVAALAKIETRLISSMPEPRELSVFVLDHEMVNAFALPGNTIVFFRGLLEAAQTPEEVASVFAHEIGHVVSRDPTRHALRSAGSIGVLGLLFGDFAGGTIVLLLAEQLIEASYSQDAEAAADLFAHKLLSDAGIAPSALADMFERFGEIGGEPEGFVAHFQSHPALGDRIAAAREATPEGILTRPLLGSDEWQALQNICD